MFETYEWLNRGWRRCDMKTDGTYTHADAIDDYGSDNVKRVAPGVWLCYEDERGSREPTMMIIRVEQSKNHRRD